MSPLAAACGPHPADLETWNLRPRARERLTFMTGVKQQELTLAPAGLRERTIHGGGREWQ